MRPRFGQFARLKLRAPLRPVVAWLKWFAYETPFVDGPKSRVKVGERCGLSNAILNTASGSITIGDNVIFGYNVMVLTGRHVFIEGVRASLATASPSKNWGGGEDEVPESGFDISIGSGSWIGSGTVISGGVQIGENSIVGANSVVLKSFPAGSFIAGSPAVLISSHQ